MAAWTVHHRPMVETRVVDGMTHLRAARVGDVLEVPCPACRGNGVAHGAFLDDFSCAECDESGQVQVTLTADPVETAIHYDRPAGKLARVEWRIEGEVSDG